GLGAAPAPRLRGVLAADVAANGPREHYMRARITPEGILADARQDSALLSVLSGSGALLVRPPHAPAAQAGDTVDYLPL
ncbi:MAG: molybdopterin molybdenumtransferase MoeA, partial [Pseudomonadota bacterium]|nr:molybdopterin molybdenumtransferase MoeA [Pseudomonadota bacterium]